MPVKFIVTVGILVAAAGTLAIYENREQILDFVDEQRRRFAHSLRHLADRINPERERQTEVPLASRAFSPLSSISHEDTAFRGVGITSSWREPDNDGQLRRRGVGSFSSSASGWNGDGERSGSSNLLFETVQENVGIIPVRRRRGSTSTLGNATDITVETPASSRPNTASVGAAAGLGVAGVASVAADVDAMEESSQPYWSIHEWAESATGSSGSSLVGSADEATEALSEFGGSEVGEIGSDAGEIESVGSWTEVESAGGSEH